MSVFLTDCANLAYSAIPPVLLAASSDVASARAERTIRSFGLQVGARLTIAEAPDRIQQQARIGAIWVELDHDHGAPLDALLERVSTDVDRGIYAAVISATSSLIDPLFARLRSDDVQVIIDASDLARASALAIATAQRETPLRVSDVGNDRSSERLRHLSDEVSRIASTLARLSANSPAFRPGLDAQLGGDVPDISAEAVRSVIRARRLRDRYFPAELFADPAWDMLLDLLQAEIAQLRVPVSNLCLAAAVPATTALRWLKSMVAEGLFVRRADPLDGRRVLVELAPEASRSLRLYFAELGQVAVI
jgi:hypothetical protein